MNQVKSHSGRTTDEAEEDPSLAGEGPPVATPEDTRAEMTRLSARGYLQVRHVLVQLPNEKKSRASTLAKAVTRRKHRALLLYLLLLTCWPWLKNRRNPLEADVWVRALTPPTGTSGPTWSKSTLSRAWKDLEDLGLVEPAKRSGRRRLVTPRREDGKARYQPPAGRTDRLNAYFTLPDSFWNDGLFANLTLPGLAMLLIIAKETNNKDEMWMPYRLARDWYGITDKTAQNGIANLEKHGLLHRRPEPIKAKLSATGTTTRFHYSLKGDYGHKARAAQQAKARRERARRVGDDDVSPPAASAKKAQRSSRPRADSQRTPGP